jgi:hypothetical protein
MKFTIAGTTYELAQSKVTFAEAKAVERVTGHTFQAIQSDPTVQQSTDVIQAMIWISMKRVDPTLSFSDIDDVEIDGIEWESEEPAPDPTELVASPESPQDVALTVSE